MGVTSRRRQGEGDHKEKEDNHMVKEKWRNWPDAGPVTPVEWGWVDPAPPVQDVDDVLEGYTSDELNYQLFQAKANHRGWVELAGRRIQVTVVRAFLDARDELVRRPPPANPHFGTDPAFPIRVGDTFNLNEEERVMCRGCRCQIVDASDCVVVHLRDGSLGNSHDNESCRRRAWLR